MSERTRIRIHPERAVPEETAEILSKGIVAHVGFVVDGQPLVLPFSYMYDMEKPDFLYIHGAVKSRALLHLATGADACVTVTLTDELVYSRKAMNHSMNYRSAMVFGKAREITEEGEKYALFDDMVQRYFLGRTIGEHYNAPPSTDLGITTLLELKIEDRSAKARRGGPTGPDDDDPNALGTAGLVDLHMV